MKAYKDMNIDMDASTFEMPSMDTKSGEKLEDGSITISFGSSDISMMKMTIHITDRKVESKETIQTTAGNFKCIKLSQKINTKMVMSMVSYTKEWYAEDIGMVKSESYDKNMKLQGYSLLTKLE